MTRTAAEVFPEEAGNVSVQLRWGDRRESAVHTAVRLMPTLHLLRRHVEEPNGRHHLRWRTEPDYRNYVIPYEIRNLAWLIQPRYAEVPGIPWSGATPLSFRLFEEDSADLPEIICLSVTSGADDGSWNGFTLTLPGAFDLGDPAGAGEWFRELVRLWQPDWAVLETGASAAAAGQAGESGQAGEPVRASAPVRARAGYLTWLSAKAFGTLPEDLGDLGDLSEAAAVPFGEGTFLTLSDWTVPAAAALNHRLQEAGLLLDLPRVQDVPAMPPLDPHVTADRLLQGRITVRLALGRRWESAAGVAARILATLRHIEAAPGAGQAQWMMPRRVGLKTQSSAVPGTVDGLAPLIESPRQRDNPLSPFSTGTLKTEFRLVAATAETGAENTAETGAETGAGTDPEGRTLYKFEAEAGSTTGGEWDNVLTLELPSWIPTGSPHDALEFFTGLVRIWEPETAVLSTSNSADHLDRDRKKISAGHLTWLSADVFGRPEGSIPGARVEESGTLFTTPDWSVLAVPILWEQLEKEQMLTPTKLR